MSVKTKAPKKCSRFNVIKMRAKSHLSSTVKRRECSGCDTTTSLRDVLVLRLVTACPALSISPKAQKILSTSFLSPESHSRRNINGVVIKCGLKFDLNCFDLFLMVGNQWRCDQTSSHIYICARWQKLIEKAFSSFESENIDPTPLPGTNLDSFVVRKTFKLITFNKFQVSPNIAPRKEWKELRCLSLFWFCFVRAINIVFMDIGITLCYILIWH